MLYSCMIALTLRGKKKLQLYSSRLIICKSKIDMNKFQSKLMSDLYHLAKKIYYNQNLNFRLNDTSPCKECDRIHLSQLQTTDWLFPYFKKDI